MHQRTARMTIKTGDVSGYNWDVTGIDVWPKHLDRNLNTMFMVI